MSNEFEIRLIGMIKDDLGIDFVDDLVTWAVDNQDRLNQNEDGVLTELRILTDDSLQTAAEAAFQRLLAASGDDEAEASALFDALSAFQQLLTAVSDDEAVSSAVADALAIVSLWP